MKRLLLALVSFSLASVPFHAQETSAPAAAAPAATAAAPIDWRKAQDLLRRGLRAGAGKGGGQREQGRSEDAEARHGRGGKARIMR
jgi:hypothetical protein